MTQIISMIYSFGGLPHMLVLIVESSVTTHISWIILHHSISWSYTIQYHGHFPPLSTGPPEYTTYVSNIHWCPLCVSDEDYYGEYPHTTPSPYTPIPRAMALTPSSVSHRLSFGRPSYPSINDNERSGTAGSQLVTALHLMSLIINH
jgi:hypothetical protein